MIPLNSMKNICVIGSFKYKSFVKRHKGLYQVIRFRLDSSPINLSIYRIKVNYPNHFLFAKGSKRKTEQTNEHQT